MTNETQDDVRYQDRAKEIARLETAQRGLMYIPQTPSQSASQLYARINQRINELRGVA